MILRLQLKMLLIQIIFEWKVSMNQKNEVKSSFRLFLQIYEWFLNPQTAKDVVYVFRALFGFCNFQATSCFLQKLGKYSFDSALNLFNSLCKYALHFVFASLLKSAYKIGAIYFKEIATTTITTTTATAINNKASAYSGPRPTMQIVGQGRKYKNKLRRQGWYMQTQAPGW